MKIPFVGEREPKIRANYQLTPLGESKAEEFKVTGSRGIVMNALRDCQPATVAEVSREARMSPDKVLRILNSLQGDGWIMRRTDS